MHHCIYHGLEHHHFTNLFCKLYKLEVSELFTLLVEKPLHQRVDEVYGDLADRQSRHLSDDICYPPCALQDNAGCVVQQGVVDGLRGDTDDRLDSQKLKDRKKMWETADSHRACPVLLPIPHKPLGWSWYSLNGE